MNLKTLFLLLFAFFSFNGISQTEKIAIPKGVVYKYCKPKKYTKAKALLLDELVKNNPSYKLVNKPFFMGPVIWDRLNEIDSIKETSAIKVDLHVNKALLEARYYNDPLQARVVWNHIRAEFNGTPMRLRKATSEELVYYWTVIAYDIEEPLIIAETPTSKFIFDIDKKSMALVWLDQMPNDLRTWLNALD